ncbi:hypothetical protein LTR29_015119 [Friedmanniomyces endolithicus]|nr:hypothetical protein LTR29_015119 [Friedmanniomyces endolithicus]
MAALVIVASLALADKLEKKKQARKDRKAAASELRVAELRAEMGEKEGDTGMTGTGAGANAGTGIATGSEKRRDSGGEWWEFDSEEVGARVLAQQEGARVEEVRAPPPPLEYEEKAAGGAGGKRSRLLRAW